MTTTKINSLVFLAFLILLTNSLNINLRNQEELFAHSQVSSADGCVISLTKTQHIHDNDSMAFMSQIQDNIDSFKNCNIYLKQIRPIITN